MRESMFPSPATPASDARATDERPYLLERVGEAAVVQLYADGFNTLSLNEKRLAWHLYQAAVAGRDIYYDQRYVHNLEMRDVLEAVLQYPAGDDPESLAAITRYTKLFWINTGPYNNLTARKFALECDPDAFARAVRHAAAAGAALPLAPGEDVHIEGLRRAVLTLQDEYRLPLLMQVLGGFSTAEIAGELGLTQAAVLTRLFRARNRLRTIYGLEPAEDVE